MSIPEGTVFMEPRCFYGVMDLGLSFLSTSHWARKAMEYSSTQVCEAQLAWTQQEKNLRHQLHQWALSWCPVPPLLYQNHCNTCVSVRQPHLSTCCIPWFIEHHTRETVWNPLIRVRKPRALSCLRSQHRKSGTYQGVPLAFLCPSAMPRNTDPSTLQSAAWNKTVFLKQTLCLYKPLRDEVLINGVGISCYLQNHPWPKQCRGFHHLTAVWRV